MCGLFFSSLVLIALAGYFWVQQDPRLLGAALGACAVGILVQLLERFVVTKPDPTLSAASVFYTGTDEDFRKLLAAGQKIPAIKLYRQRYGVGLKEAKEAVERMVAGEPPAQIFTPSAFVSAPTGSDEDIRQLADSGNVISAIMLYRERHGTGLKEAKDAVERMI